MRALITGGAGFIGSHLAEALLERGDHVTVVDDLSTGRFENVEHLTANPRFQAVVETIMNETVMDRLVSECDILYHLAAAVGVELIVKSPVHTIETNVMGTEIVLRTARRYRKKVLIASTSEIYGKSEDTPYKEDDDRLLGPTTRSRWSYSASKALDEFLALAYNKEMGLPVVIFRLFNTIGPRQRGRYGMVVPRFVKQALAGEPITVYGDGKQSRCFCNVRDAVRAIDGLAESPGAEGGVFNIGSTDEINILDLARRVKDKTGSPSLIVLVPYEQATAPGFEDMRRRMPDVSKIRRTIGWGPTISLDQTLDEIIAYFGESGLSADTITQLAMPGAVVVR
ncbi:MAG: GDP-mannose 4,6-dehydratase [Chloroflexi bacterium]|nr:GDP-mannose 4,6-dehydratase [Chloroflexota bacterium]